MPIYPIQDTCDLKTGNYGQIEKRDWENNVGGNGEPIYPGNDWDIADRQSDDRARAEENADNRQRHDWEARGQDYKGAYPEPAITINTTRRWGGNQDKGEENERTRRTRKISPLETCRGENRK